MTTRLRKTQTQPTGSLEMPVGPAGVTISSEETTGLRKTQTQLTSSLEIPVGPAGVKPVSSKKLPNSGKLRYNQLFLS